VLGLFFLGLSSPYIHPHKERSKEFNAHSYNKTKATKTKTAGKSARREPSDKNQPINLYQKI